jgi:Tfp pilus assembly protein FimT
MAAGGLTLLETLISLTMLGILVALIYPMMFRLMMLQRLKIVSFELLEHWKLTRMQATGNGSYPTTLCMGEFSPGQISYTQIAGSQCETATQWIYLTTGVSIDTDNSTLRTVNGVAGNGGTIYRVSWADTRAGYGASYGQLGKIVLTIQGLSYRTCLVLYNVDGSLALRYNEQCQRR